MMGIHGARGLGGIIVLFMWWGSALAHAATPPWVGTGRSPDLRAETHLTGYGESHQSLEQAKQSALRDLALKMEAQVHSKMTDISKEAGGRSSVAVVSVTQTTTDVRLSHVAYRTHRGQDHHFALAFVPRTEAAKGLRTQLAQAQEQARACIDRARTQRDRLERRGNLATCRTSVTTGLRHAATLMALMGDSAEDRTARSELRVLWAAIEDALDAAGHSPATSWEDLGAALAVQLRASGLGVAPATVAPFLFEDTDFSSELGHRLASNLERALMRPGRGKGGKPAVVRGSYRIEGDSFRAIATAQDSAQGEIRGVAETTLPASAIPAGLQLKPRNYTQALEDQRVLKEGELIEGSLRVEVWTHKGKRGLVFEEGEEMRLFLRVNQPAYVRLVYILNSGHKVPLEQSYYIDATKVNMAVEYPDTFEVIGPFGIEQLHATAFTQRPEHLKTKTVPIGGEPYEVVAGTGAAPLVQHRGLRRKKKTKVEIGEASLVVTTVARRTP